MLLLLTQPDKLFVQTAPVCILVVSYYNPAPIIITTATKNAPNGLPNAVNINPANITPINPTTNTFSFFISLIF